MNKRNIKQCTTEQAKTKKRNLLNYICTLHTQNNDIINKFARVRNARKHANIYSKTSVYLRWNAEQKTTNSHTHTNIVHINIIIMMREHDVWAELMISEHKHSMEMRRNTKNTTKTTHLTYTLDRIPTTYSNNNSLVITLQAFTRWMFD